MLRVILKFQSVSLNEVLTPYEVLEIFPKSKGRFYIFRNLNFKSLNLHNYFFKVLNTVRRGSRGNLACAIWTRRGTVLR